MTEKKISVLVPCYNEEENVVPLSEAIEQELKALDDYDYEIVFIDNFSVDSTREKLESLCAQNRKIKAIFNARNFGQFNSPYYGYLQCTGDCVISMCADFQDPPEMIPKLVKEWEEGAKIVCAIKETSKENPFIRSLRSAYYKIIKKMSEVEQIEHFTGFGLYDRSFLEVLRSLDDPTPFLRGIVAELGFRRVMIPYEQQKRRAGKTSNNFSRLYDAAMLSFTTYTKSPVRFVTFFGFALLILSLLAGITVGILAACYVIWDFMPYVLLCVMCFMFGGVFCSIGMIGEYLLTVKSKVTKRPLAVEERRINFD